MMELIHMTAIYSNAVLVAVLPHVSQFAERLDLPIQRPVVMDQVTWSSPSPYKDYIVDALVLKGHYWFEIDPRGFVEGFRAPTNWFAEQKFTDVSIRRYLGQDHMTTNEVVSMARDVLSKLGFGPELTNSFGPPVLKGPFDLHRKEIAGHVPFCRVIWEWPKIDNAVDQNHIKMDINMETKQLVGLTLSLSRTNRLDTTPIQVDAVPELESDYRKRVRASSGRMFINTNAPPRFPGKSEEKE